MQYKLTCSRYICVIGERSLKKIAANETFRLKTASNEVKQIQYGKSTNKRKGFCLAY